MKLTWHSEYCNHRGRERHSASARILGGNSSERLFGLQLPRLWPALPFQWLLPVAFLMVGAVYLYAAPNFEASDTVQHVGMIKWIAERGELPLQSARHEHLYGQEASQPPLYYLLMAGVWQAFDTSDFAARYLPSPFTVIGETLSLGNRNLVIYKQVYPPDLRGSSLALYAIRLLGLGMGAATVAAVYQSARTALPGRRGLWLLAGALTAFNPQFLFISASVSNDNLINMLAALIAWQTLLMLRDGFGRRRSLLLAVLIALAALTKLSGLVVGAVAGLAAIVGLIRWRDWRGFGLLVGAVLLCFAVIALWWYLRNLRLYGEIFGTAAMLEYFGRRSISPWQLFLSEFEGLRVSYWAVFGAFNIVAHDAFYRVMDALSLLGALGLARFVVLHRHSRELMTQLAALALLLVLGGFMLIWWSAQTWASTGRLLFPYITSASILLALGLSVWRIPPVLLVLPLLAFSLAAPFLYIVPNYDHPRIVERLPEKATARDVQWEDIRLTGYELPAAREWRAGADIPVSFYWASRAHSPLAYALVLSLLNADGERIAGFETWPGWGTMPHPWMELGRAYQDEYIMRIPTDAKTSPLLTLEIRWYVFPYGADLPARLETGEEAPGLRLPLGRLAGW